MDSDEEDPPPDPKPDGPFPGPSPATAFVPRPRRFPESHKGPYVVFINEKETPIAPIKFSKYLHDTYNAIIKCENLRNKIRVTLNNCEQANLLALDPFFSHYRVHIPAEEVEIYGVVHLPGETDYAGIITYGKGKFRHPDLPLIDILDVRRIRKRVEPTNMDSEWVDTPLVKVCFAGSVLPDNLEIEKLLIPVQAANEKPMFCDNCQAFKHTRKYCRSNPVCAVCRGNHTTEKCSIRNTPSVICPYCLEVHEPDTNTCSFFTDARRSFAVVQKRKQKGAYAKILAAARRATPPNPNPLNPEEFPPLNNLNQASSIYVISAHHPSSSNATSTNLPEPLDIGGEPSQRTSTTSQSTLPRQTPLPFKNPWAAPTGPKVTTEERAAKRKRSNRQGPTETTANTNPTRRQQQTRQQPPPGFARTTNGTTAPPMAWPSTGSVVKDIIEFVCRKLELPPIMISAVHSFITPFLENLWAKYSPLSAILSTAGRPVIPQNV